MIIKLKNFPMTNPKMNDILYERNIIYKIHATTIFLCTFDSTECNY